MKNGGLQNLVHGSIEVMRNRPLRRYLTAGVIIANLVVTAGLTWMTIPFAPVKEVLAVSAWGAGTPASTCITAFATLRPWWKQLAPEAVRVTSEGGIEPLVRLPRSAIRTTGEAVLPSRSLGYDAILGALVGVRSLFSSDLIYDFRMLILIQRTMLVLVLILAPLALYLTHPSFHRPVVFVVYNAAYLPVLFLWPNYRMYLTEGIIDNTLANAFALIGVGAMFLLMRNLSLESRRSAIKFLGASLILSYCTMVRGEFLFIYAFTLVFLTLITLRNRAKLKGLALAFVLLFTFPLAYGLTNKTIFGHFVPLRLQSGQNLFEPIGQFPNPYGIRYDDVWLGQYLKTQGYEYLSFETDHFLTKKYFQILFDNPKLFLDNLTQRLRFFANTFGVWLFPWTIPCILLLVGMLAYLDERFVVVCVPLVMAVGYLLFFGWLNSMFRLVTPVHFLINVFLCFFAIYVVVGLGWKEIRGSFRRTAKISLP